MSHELTPGVFTGSEVDARPSAACLARDGGGRVRELVGRLDIRRRRCVDRGVGVGLLGRRRRPWRRGRPPRAAMALTAASSGGRRGGRHRRRRRRAGGDGASTAASSGSAGGSGGTGGTGGAGGDRAAPAASARVLGGAGGTGGADVLDSSASSGSGGVDVDRGVLVGRPQAAAVARAAVDVDVDVGRRRSLRRPPRPQRRRHGWRRCLDVGRGLPVGLLGPAAWVAATPRRRP